MNDPDEIENGAEAANDTVEHSDDDTSDELDYFDPDEGQDTEEVEQPEDTDDETVEVEAEDEAEDQETEDQPDEDPDKVTVTLDDGTSVPLNELKKGYFRQADYSRKTAEVAETRKALDANTQRIEGVTKALVDHIATMIPAEPDPALALSNPGDFVAKKAQYDAAMAQVQKLIEVGTQAKSVTDELSAEDRQTQNAQDGAKLAEMFPALKDPETRKTFFNAANQAALDVGFSPVQLSSVTDPKMIALAHWAKIGMDAEKANTKAKAKVQKAPPASPRKPGGKANAAKNTNAMQKLARSGSLNDAMNVDFD